MYIRNRNREIGKKCVEALKGIVKLTGRSKEQLEQRNRVSKQAVETLKKFIPSVSQGAKLLAVRWHFFKQMQLEPTTIPKERSKQQICAKQSMSKFFLQPELSVSLGGMKATNRKGEAVRYLSMRVEDAHKLYMQEKNQKVPYSTFAKARPKKLIKLRQHIPTQDCQCRDCGNVDLILDAIRKFKKDEIFENKFNIINATLCKRAQKCSSGSLSDMLECILRTCNTCGTKKIKNSVRSQRITFQQWDYITRPSNKGKAESKQMALVEVKGTVPQMFQILRDKLQPFAWHLFIAKWQQQQLDSILKKIPSDTVIFIQDFAQNYLSKYQNEVQGLHWSYQQVTQHPIICYFTCGGQTIKSDFICISNDLNHDVWAVEAFQAAVEENLEMNGITIQNRIIFSDGCARQYKGKTSFSLMCQKGVVPTQRIFFGSSHGKNACDAATGVLKRSLKAAINSKEVVITNGNDMNYYCNAKLAHDNTHGDHSHVGKAYLLVDDIQRPKKQPELKPIKNSGMLHQIKNVPEQPKSLLVREMACFCNGCLNGGPCEEGVPPFWNASVDPKAKKSSNWRNVSKPASKSAQKTPAKKEKKSEPSSASKSATKTAAKLTEKQAKTARITRTTRSSVKTGIEQLPSTSRTMKKTPANLMTEKKRETPRITRATGSGSTIEVPGKANKTSERTGSEKAGVAEWSSGNTSAKTPSTKTQMNGGTE